MSKPHAPKPRQTATKPATVQVKVGVPALKCAEAIVEVLPSALALPINTQLHIAAIVQVFLDETVAEVVRVEARKWAAR